MKPEEPKSSLTPDASLGADMAGRSKEEEEKAVLTDDIRNRIISGEFSPSELTQIPSELHREIALKLIEAEEDHFFTYNLDKFQGLDQEVASKLIEAGRGNCVAHNLDKFQGLDQEVASKLIEAGRGDCVAHNLDKFQGLDHKEIVSKLIETGQGHFVAHNLDKFQGLDQEVASKLIETGLGNYVADDLDKFQGLDHKEIASKLIGAGQGHSVAENLNKFQGLDHKEIASKLIETGQSFAIETNLDKFRGLDQEIALKLIETVPGFHFVHKLNNFQGLGHKIALKLIEIGQGHSVAENLNNFQGLDQEIASKLIGAGLGNYVADNLNKFQGLDHKEIASKLIGAGRGAYVADNLNKFQGLDDESVAALFLNDLPEGMRGHVASYFKGWIGFVRPTLGNFLEQLKGLDTAVSYQPEMVKNLLDPAIKAQGIGAFRVLKSIGKLEQAVVVGSTEDQELLAHLATTKGVRANDALLFLVQGVGGPAPDRDFLDEEGQNIGWQADQDFSASGESAGTFLKTPLSENPHLRPFLDSGLPLIDSLYAEYERIMDDASANPAQRNEGLNALRERVREMIEKVHSGEMEEADLRDNTFIGMVFHAFPPATTLDRGQYRNLLSRREDRQDDLPEEWAALNEAPEAGLEVAGGVWVLKEGEHFDVNAWKTLSESIREVNAKPVDKWDDEAAAQAGRRLIEALGDQKAMNKDRAALLKTVYAFHRSANGATLTTDISSREGLLEVKEYAGDRMKDTIDLLLKAGAKADPTGYEKAVKEATTVSLKDKAKKGIVKQMLNILGTSTMDSEETNARLKAVLDRYGIHAEGDVLAEALKAVEGIPERDDAGQRAAVEAFLKTVLDGAALGRNAGKLSVDIANRLIGEDYAAMQEEMGHYEFREDVGAGRVETFRLEVSKKRAHAATGLNMGVCVAIDEDLWNKPEFSNVILWDAEGMARGGMHFEIVEDGGKKYLSLPGINPSGSVIGQAGAEKLFDGLLAYAKEAARRIGAEAVLIPMSGIIHSNRAEIQSVIAGKGYKTLSLSDGKHQFSYDPYDYAWQDAYVVEVGQEQGRS